MFLRATNFSDSVEATVIRKQRKMKKIQARAVAHAKKMMNFDIAVQRIATFGQNKRSIFDWLKTK